MPSGAPGGAEMMTSTSTSTTTTTQSLGGPTQTKDTDVPVKQSGEPKAPPTQSFPDSSTNPTPDKVVADDSSPIGDGAASSTPNKAGADGSDAAKDDDGGGGDDDDSGVLVIVIIVVVAVACVAITALLAHVRQQQNQTSKVLGSLAASRKDTLAARGSSSGTATAAAARRPNDANKRVVHNAAFDQAAALVAGTGAGDVDYHDRVLPDDDGDYHDMVLPDAPAHAGGRTVKGSGTAAPAPPQRSTRSQVSAGARVNDALAGPCRPPFLCVAVCPRAHHVRPGSCCLDRPCVDVCAVAPYGLRSSPSPPLPDCAPGSKKFP